MIALHVSYCLFLFVNRANYKVTKNTVVCSNHFLCGQPREKSPHPALFLKGYETPAPRPLKERQEMVVQPPKKRRLEDKEEQTHAACVPVPYTIPEVTISSKLDHPYYSSPHTSPESCQRTLPKPCPCDKCAPMVSALEQRIANLEKEIQALKEVNDTLRQEKKMEKKKGKAGPFTITDLKEKDNIMKLYTGINSFAVFDWLYDHVKEKMKRLHYYRGSSSQATKRWQITGAEKPGRKRDVSLKDELLLVFMKLRLNLVDEDLAFRFCISPSVVSSIISTVLPFLAAELSCLIHWPDRSAVPNHLPSCFSKYGNVRAIIDCTEVQTQRPSQSDVNSKMYSDYKQRHTYKVLVACTPGGSISYLSPAAGGDMSDVHIVRASGFLDHLEKGDVVLADKGFRDKSDFMVRGAKLVIPDFSRKGITFTEEKNISNTGVSNARSHVERVIGRIKEFRILKGDFPLLRNDMIDHVFCVCGVLVNLQGILVPR